MNLVKKHVSNCYKHVILDLITDEVVVQEAKQEFNDRKAMFHLRFRWLGAPLFFSGCIIFFLVVTTFSQTYDYFSLLLSFGCVMSGLTVFGVNHNTAMALAATQFPDLQKLPEPLRKEMEEDLAWDQAKTLSLRPNPKTSLVIPLISILLQGYVIVRLSCHVDMKWFAEQCKDFSFLF